MDTASSAFWRRCSNCKSPIALGGRYFVCSVSSCQRVRAPIQFCKDACWEVHNEIENHRDGWCEERRAPMTPDEVGEEKPARSEEPRKVVRDVARPAPASSVVSSSAAASSTIGSAAATGLAPADREQLEEVLVVVSRLKGYIRTRSSGMNTSDDVLPLLSDHLRKLCDDAIGRARTAGRKTVMARDFPRA